MLAIETTPPPPGSYRFVLRRYDKDPIHKIAAYTYDESTNSLAIELDGVIAHTLFLSTEPARDYWTKKGWLDETARWEARLARTTMPPTPAKLPPVAETKPVETPPAETSKAAPRPPYPGPAADSLADPDARLVARARELIWNAGKPVTVGQIIAKLGEPEARVRAVLHAAAASGTLTERGSGSIVLYGLPAEGAEAPA